MAQSSKFQFDQSVWEAMVAQAAAAEEKKRVKNKKFEARPAPRPENVGNEIEQMTARVHNWHQKTQYAVIDIRYLHATLKSSAAKNQLIKDIKNEIMQQPIPLKELLSCLSNNFHYDLSELYARLEEKNKDQPKEEEEGADANKEEKD